MPNSSKGALTMSWPTAMRMMSASTRCWGLDASTGAGLPLLTGPIIWGCTTRARQWPASSASMATGDMRAIISTPSPMALSTSLGRAVMSSSLRR